MEGGGNTRELQSKRRQAFSDFFRKAGLSGRMPRVIPSGGGQKTYDKFRTALTHAAKQEYLILLVDGEGPVANECNP